MKIEEGSLNLTDFKFLDIKKFYRVSKEYHFTKKEIIEK